ncbi:ADP-ribosylglycohydrolase family protein [Gottschalkiaceae bacterium SANA]|nr:ADP-ribosylglycohydrolase family protein [Gottschalkiaceae bacterium SANA]
MYNKILGVLLGAAVGDAMGAATELRTPDEIIQTFGHWVTEFETPPADVFAGGRKAGQITDDFSSAYFIIQAILSASGKITPHVARAGILAWAKSEYFETFAGPTTRAAIHELIEEGQLKENSLLGRCGKATNGAAMKAFAGGVFLPGNWNSAVDAAISIAEVTHPYHLCLSGAAAIAAAVSEAISEKATVGSIFDAGIYGAKRGAQIGIERGMQIAGPSVWKRMELAREIVVRESDPTAGLFAISELIGTGIHVSESVPAVFGILCLSKGDVETGIQYAVNIGDDTDTIATMVGAILGGFNGASGWGDKYIAQIEENNQIDLQGMTREILGFQSEGAGYVHGIYREQRD